METKKITSFADLLDELGKLTKEQLRQPVRVLSYGEYRRSISLFIAEEDFICFMGDIIEPISAYKDDPETLASEPIAFREGDIYILPLR